MVLSGMFLAKAAMTPTGSEHNSDSTGKTRFSQRGGAKTGAFSVDSDLEAVIAAWSRLPKAIRRAIVALVVVDFCE
jgi:hypothetical protein